MKILKDFLFFYFLCSSAIHCPHKTWKLFFSFWVRKKKIPSESKYICSLNQYQKEGEFGYTHTHVMSPHVTTTNIWTHKKYLHCGNYVHRKWQKKISAVFCVFNFNSKHVIHTIFVFRKSSEKGREESLAWFCGFLLKICLMLKKGAAGKQQLIIKFIWKLNFVLVLMHKRRNYNENPLSHIFLCVCILPFLFLCSLIMLHENDKANN